MAQTDSLAYAPISIWFIFGFILLYITIYILLLYIIFIIYRSRVDYYNLLLNSVIGLVCIVNKIRRSISSISIKYLFKTYNYYILILFMWAYSVFMLTRIIYTYEFSLNIHFFHDNLYFNKKYWI